MKFFIPAFLLFSAVLYFGGYTAPAFAQDAAAESSSGTSSTESGDWFLQKPIVGFDFTGLAVIKRGDLFNVLSQYRNKPFTYDLLGEMQNTLYSLDFFVEITPEAQRNAVGDLMLIFKLVEYPSVASISMFGNRRLGRATLLNALTLRRGDLINQDKADRAADEIRKKYVTEGYGQAEVRVELTPAADLENQSDITFYITEGERTAISSITFTGNTVISARSLARVITSKKKSIFNKGVYDEAAVEADKTQITQEYFKRGYLDAAVTDVKVEQSQQEDLQGITITFVISEGQQFRFRELTFSGNTVFSDKELYTLFPFKPGDVADGTKFQRGYDAVRLMYANKGFLFNAYDYKEAREGEASVSYEILITEYGQAHISNIAVQGNIKTKDYVITRELGFTIGSVVSFSRLQQARSALLALGYLESVEPEIKPGASEGLVDLIVNVKERSGRDLRAGATFGGNTEFPLSLFLSWNQSNLGGRGYALNSRITASPVEQAIEVTFIDPRVFNSPLLFSATLGFSHERVNNVPQDVSGAFLEDDSNRATQDPLDGTYVFTKRTNYNGTDYEAGQPFPSAAVPSDADIKNFSLQRDYDFFGSRSSALYNSALMSYDNFSIYASIGTGYTYYSPFGRLGTRISVGPTFNYVLYDDAVFRPANLQLRKNLNNFKIYNAFNTTVFYDSRDVPAEPTSGLYISQGLTFYGGILFGDSHYIRSNTVLEGHLPLVNLRVSENWAFKLVLAANSTFDAIFPQFFYPPGTSFKENGPQYSQRLRLNGIYNARGWGTVYNGAATWNSWLELRMSLLERVVWFDTFFEVAGLWTELNQINIIDPKRYYFSFGAGFRFVIPQFPIRIYIAKRFNLDDALSLKWQRGNLSASPDKTDDSGVDLVFSIGFSF